MTLESRWIMIFLKEFPIAKHVLFHFIKCFSHTKKKSPMPGQNSLFATCRYIHRYNIHSTYTKANVLRTESIFLFLVYYIRSCILLYLFMSILLTNRPPKKKRKRVRREWIKLLLLHKFYEPRKQKSFILKLKNVWFFLSLSLSPHSFLFWC